MNTWAGWTAAAVCVGLAGVVRGSVGTGLTLDPWEAGQRFESLDRFVIEDQGHVKETGDRTHYFMWDSGGRFRVDPNDARSVVVGYRILTIDTGIHNSAVMPTSELNNLAVAAAVPVGRLGEWDLTAIGGVGYNGNSPINDGQATYGIGHFVAQRALSATDSLALTLDYDGHDALTPDVPVPGVAYTHRTADFSWTVGYPRMMVEWRPAERWVLEARWAAPLSGEATASYEVAKGLRLYGMYTNFFEAFQPSDAGRAGRQFFEQQRAEAGVRIIWGQWVDLSVGAGYAFGQNLTQGYSACDRDHVADLSDRPYVALVLRGAF